jgi:hypothetical protein
LAYLFLRAAQRRDAFLQYYFVSFGGTLRTIWPTPIFFVAKQAKQRSPCEASRASEAGRKNLEQVGARGFLSDEA